MPRRIEIELTSRNGEGAFTWRAAGAKQPRGTVSTDLLPGGVGVGDVVRAEVASGLDGLEIVAVLRPQEKDDDRPSNRIELLDAPRRGPDVSVSYASGRSRRDGTEAGSHRGRETTGRGPRARRGPGDAPTELRPSRGRRERADRHAAPSRPRGPTRGARGEPNGAPREGPARGAPDEQRPARPEHAARREPALVRRERRPTISTAHRNAVLATLGPQELPIAEQLLRGGIPAVRQALAEQYGAHPADAAAQANRDAVLAVAETLLPRVSLASWKDRAVSAQAAGKELRLRELRAVVTSARTVTLDDEARTMSRTLQEMLEQRVRSLREEWISRMERALEAGRVADAVRVSSRAPEPASRLPAELAVRLADAAGQVMTAQMAVPEWIALLGAVVESPVRRNVRPQGIPEDDQAKDAARHAAGSVPELARLLGLRIPPPPPRRPVSRGPGVMAAGGARPADAR